MVLIEWRRFHLNLERPLNVHFFMKYSSAAMHSHPRPRKSRGINEIAVMVVGRLHRHVVFLLFLDTNVRQRGIGGVDLRPKMVARPRRLWRPPARTFLARW